MIKHNDKLMVRWFTYEQFHAKKGIGSTRIRVHNLLKYWPEAELYRFGEKPDVLIFQKVYQTMDYHLPEHYPGIKILDVCDPDWRDTPDIFIKQTMDLMDAVVVPTEQFREYLQQMTDTPVRVIKDRFDLSEFPAPKVHEGKIKQAIWFGYAHNIETMRFAIRALEHRNIGLKVVSNDDPMAYRWADNKDYEEKYTYLKYEHPPYEELQTADVAIFPVGVRPFDRFKSENKTIIANLCGLPVAQDADQLDALNTAEARNSIDYAKLRSEYDVKVSVEQYKELINEIKANRR